MKSMITLLASIVLLMAWTDMAQADDPAARCKVCHHFEKDGRNGVGPNLFGVYGRQVGIKEDFRYSPVMKTRAWSWDEAHLRRWVCNSPEAAKSFSGDASAHVRMPPMHMCGDKADAIIAYLKTLK